ncbi:DNA-binding transcriptional MerR regulator [Actinoplanes lutulentus]|uniref:DNA-binding transcriptional MerR regulator n=1 Tax=Actinoplanes lutulentus TaxID=1287878 RepID=A0A327ZD66_9ACTN|nr:DNA-binding transcriptional MerR regulator [Actinoplanes lutulentus]RAK38228.1 DNA-binding transcriptional MerR regulator [Actinoplanes lutulentus]
MNVSSLIARRLRLKSQKGIHRPADLAQLHGLSAQAVRNYERDGFLPPARRSAAGYRLYTDQHVVALGAYLALIAGYGHRTAGEIMRLVHEADLPRALAAIDGAHVLLQRDRETLESVSETVSVLAHPAAPAFTGSAPVTVGVLAHRLGVVPATLRKWERAGILTPARDRTARVYSPADVRDADLAHLLRRGGYLLGHIASVLRQVRSAGGPEPLAASLAGWQDRINTRARLMLTGSARLAAYLEYAAPPVGVTGGAAVLSDDQRG